MKIKLLQSIKFIQIIQLRMVIKYYSFRMDANNLTTRAKLKCNDNGEQKDGC